MNSFIVLTVAIGLISVQVSSIIQQVLDNDHGLNNDRDYTIVDDREAIISGQFRDELQNMETREDDILEKQKLFDCQDRTCKACVIGVCLSFSYNPSTSEFTFGIDYMKRRVFEYTLKRAIRWSDCEKIDLKFIKQTVCIKVDNFKTTSGGPACLDAKFSSGIYSKTFKDICM